jgi:hypothetical protein
MRHTDRNFTCACAAPSIICRKAYVIDASISCSISLSPYPGGARSHAFCIWASVAAATSLNWLILEDAVNRNGYWISIRVGYAQNINRFEFVIGREQFRITGGCTAAIGWGGRGSEENKPAGNPVWVGRGPTPLSYIVGCYERRADQ